MISSTLEKSDSLFAGADFHDPACWRIQWKLKKFAEAQTHDETIGKEPDEIISYKGNLLMYGGVSCIWESLIGNATTTTGQNLTFFNNSNAAVGVGDSTTAPVATQTDLQASTNKTRVGMVASYPQHTDGVVSGSASITFQASFPATGGTAANYTWNEVGIFNSSTGGTGRMLNRLAPSGGFGTKSGGTWSMTVTITIS
jgi:hypothetical protein